jgi:hypothetical protein
MILIPLRHLARAVVSELAKLEPMAPSDATIEAAVALGITEGMRQAGLRPCRSARTV